jgi:hypothetical protein
MKVLNLKLQVLLLLIAALTSCTEELESIIDRSAKEITNTQMSNPKNPYDDEGRIHNQYLDYFGTRLSAIKEDGELTSEEIKKVTTEFYLKFLNEEKDSKDLDSVMRIFDKVGFGGQGKSQNILPDICKYFPSLCELLEFPYPELPFDLLIANGGSEVRWETAYEESLASIENLRAYEEKITGTSKGDELRLMYCAVARWSTGYWYNAQYFRDSNNAWSELFTDQIVHCATCDIIAGDTGGAAIGSLGGPIGAGIGAGIASAAVAIEYFWW